MVWTTAEFHAERNRKEWRKKTDKPKFNSRVTDNDVKEIRRSKMSVASLALMYETSAASIYSIKRGEMFSWVK